MVSFEPLYRMAILVLIRMWVTIIAVALIY